MSQPEVRPSDIVNNEVGDMADVEARRRLQAAINKSSNRREGSRERGTGETRIDVHTLDILLGLARHGLACIPTSAEESAELVAAEALASFVPDTHRLVGSDGKHAVRFDGSSGLAAQIIAWVSKDDFEWSGDTSTESKQGGDEIVLSLWNSFYGMATGYDDAGVDERVRAWAGDIIVFEKYALAARTYSDRQFVADFGEPFDAN